MNEIVVVVAPMLAVLLMILILVIITFNSIYDLFSRFYEIKASRIQPTKLPHITVIITAGTDVQAVRNCLRSLQLSSYKKYDVVVANNSSRLGSSDDLNKIISGFTVPGYYYKSRKRHAYGRLVVEAYRRSKKGDITMLVDSLVNFTDSTLQSVAEKQTALEAGRVLHVSAIDRRYGFIGVMSSFTNSLRSLLMLTGSRLVVSRYENFRTRTVFSSRYIKRFDSPGKQVYEPSIVIYGERYRDDSNVSGMRMLGLMAKAFLVMLIIYISILLVFEALGGARVESFMMTWVALTLAGLSLILFDSRTNLHHKIEAIFCVGFMPLLIALASISSVINEARSIKA